MNASPKEAIGEKGTSKEIIWTATVLFLVFLFFFPILAGWHGIFLDDVRTFGYPNAVFQSRYLKQGIIPLWDPHTFAGGVPFVTRIDALTFYLPQWLAGLTGNTKTLDAAYRTLTLLPIILHCLWGAWGGFVLGKWGIGLSRPGAAAMALTFALSSSMVGGILNPPMVMSLAWHPWLAAAVMLYIRRPSCGRFFLGIVIFTLAIPSWSNYVAHGLFLAALFAGVGLVQQGLKKGWSRARKTAIGLMAMIVIAGLLNAPYILSLVEATGYVQETMPPDYAFLTDGPRSVPWRWLSTIFIPELFASTNYAVRWGVAEEQKMYWCEAIMTRGMLLWLPAALAIWSGLLAAVRCQRCRKQERSALDAWTWFASGLLCLSLVLLLGRHTPFFGMLYRFFPLFRIPYASRWHTMMTMGLALLTGIGVSRLLEGGLMATRRRLITYLGLATLAALVAVALPVGYWEKLTDSSWFLKNPLLYWVLCVIVIFYICWRWDPKRAAKAVIVFALMDLIRNGAMDTYRSMGVTWAPEQDPGRRPSETSLFSFMSRASQYDTDPMVRTGYSRVCADDGALIFGGNSLLGVGVKPMLPRLFHTLNEVGLGMPYEISLISPHILFVRNMSTGFWWFDHQTPAETNWELVVAEPEFGLYLFRIPNHLPRIFTLDRIQPAGEKEQRRALIEDDLHQAVIIDYMDKTALRYLEGRRGPVSDENVRTHFALLQEANQIVLADFSHPNRVLIDLDISVPSMMVMTDVWHPGWKATVNSRQAPIHRVNHIQRGIWLEKGRNRVEMSFYPACVTTGRWFSLAGVAVGLFLFLGRRRFFCVREKECGILKWKKSPQGVNNFPAGEVADQDRSQDQRPGH